MLGKILDSIYILVFFIFNMVLGISQYNNNHMKAFGWGCFAGGMCFAFIIATWVRSDNNGNGI